MGLDALVYKHKENVYVETQDYSLIVRESYTGEVYLRDDQRQHLYPDDTFVAVEKRLGNIDCIVNIRSELRNALTVTNSILLGKILYSGFHAGDIIELTDLKALENEIKSVEKEAHIELSKTLLRFLQDVKELIKAAKEQQNPIVFV